MIKQAIRILCLLSVLLFSSLAFSDAPLGDELSQAMSLKSDPNRGKEIFHKLCSQCHGRDGWGTYDGEFPQIAGQHSSVIIKQLADIRAGTRDNPRMSPIVKESVLGGPQAMADVSAYISTLLMNPYPEVGEGNDLDKAEKMYMEMCAKCHGVNGKGDPERLYPLVQGQHFEYLLRQLIWIRDGKRRNANRGMADLIHQMSNKELKLLADYISRQLPPEEKLSPQE